jgi:hypothetical protein
MDESQLKRNVIVTITVALLMAGFVLAYVRVAPKPLATGAGRMGGPIMPSVRGYVDGKQIWFLHTEVSDPDVAPKLTKMVGTEVLVVPSLARIPPQFLANVYVFKNGVKPRLRRGPLDYQIDVFDSPPGTPTYQPLRAVNIVSWKNEAHARELESVAELRAAERNGELTIERPGVVVNIPLMTWPGGQR